MYYLIKCKDDEYVEVRRWISALFINDCWFPGKWRHNRQENGSFSVCTSNFILFARFARSLRIFTPSSHTIYKWSGGLTYSKDNRKSAIHLHWDRMLKHFLLFLLLHLELFEKLNGYSYPHFFYFLLIILSSLKHTSLCSTIYPQKFQHNNDRSNLKIISSTIQFIRSSEHWRLKLAIERKSKIPNLHLHTTLLHSTQEVHHHVHVVVT